MGRRFVYLAPAVALAMQLANSHARANCDPCSGIDGAVTPTCDWQTLAGDIESSFDDDAFTFSALAGATYNFTFCIGGGSANFDTVLTVNNAACDLPNPGLACNDDNCSLQSELSWTAPAGGGTFTIRISGFGSATGSYTLAYRRDCSAPIIGACCATMTVQGIPEPFPACVDGEFDGTLVDADLCSELNGTYLGDGARCGDPSNTTCPTGACCGTGGRATCGDTLIGTDLGITQAACESAGNVFGGAGTTCDGGACAGACCLLFFGDPICADDFGKGGSIFEEDCLAEGGTFLGPGSSCTDPSNQTCPVGACCGVETGVAGGGSDGCVDQPFQLGLPFAGGITQEVCDGIGGTFLPGQACEEETCVVAGACCTPDCGCVRVTGGECETLGGIYAGDFTTCDAPYADAVPQLTCPDPITLTRGDITECGSPLEIRDFLAGATLTGSTCDPEITHDAGECGFPPGTTTVTFTAVDCGQTFTCETTVTVDPLHRIESTQKGSLLVFSKVEIKWDAAGNLTQDTFLDFSNDFDGGAVDVQAFLINGDRTLEEITTDDGTVIQDAEPGWNRIDCRFELTKNQPHYWSAANGSSHCGPFTSLDGDGPGRPDPEVAGGRVLRGYVVMWAVKFNGEYYDEIRWNHLKGDALIINYSEGSAWEYNAWAAQARCGANGAPVQDCLITDANGTCCLAAPIPGNLGLDGFSYDVTYDRLLLDFYATGTTALSAIRADGSAGVGISLDTDLTLHSMDIDLRQDGDGPPLTKAEFEVFNQNEVKLSGLRRCICCWDQTMFSDYVQHAGIPNYFLRQRLGTDKGQARIDAVRSVVEECNYCETCGVEPRIRRAITASSGGTAGIGEIIDVCQLNFSQDTALLGLSTKFVNFENGSVKIDRAGMNLVGTGEQTRVFQLELNGDNENGSGGAATHQTTILQYGSRIQYDVPRGTDEARTPVSISAPRETRSGKGTGPGASLRGDGSIDPR